MSRSLQSIERIIVVVGCQRSGTTLTGQILGSHPSAVLIDEWDGLYPWIQACFKQGGATLELASDVLERAAEKYRNQRSRFLTTATTTTLHEDVHTRVLKAPNLTYDAEKLAALAVPLRIVYPVRDPRAVVASMMRLDQIDFVGNQRKLLESHPDSGTQFAGVIETFADESISLWVKLAILWKTKTAMAAQFAAAGTTPFQFRYEDMIRRPADIVDGLSAFCGFDDGQIPKQPHAVYVGQGPGGTDRTRAIDSHSLYKWQTTLNVSQVADIMRVAALLAEKFSYD